MQPVFLDTKSIRKDRAMPRQGQRLGFDPVAVGRSESGHVHRLDQHDDQVTDEDLVASLIRLYAYIYRAKPDDVRRAAELRAAAMALSDAWVAAGCHLDDPALAQQRLALVASFTALREASDRRGMASDCG
jgi:hypothetical protein